MILDFDAKSNPIIFKGNKWVDIFGNDVTSSKLAHFEQRGTINNIAIDATGIKTAAVTFSPAYSTTLDEVLVTLKDPDHTDAVIGGVWVSGDDKTGFTLNVNVTTASATSGAKIKASWKSLGQ